MYCKNNPIMLVDPSGQFPLTTLIILGLFGLGAALGFGAVAYADYEDDGIVFNGSIDWKVYILGTIIGGGIGAIIGYYFAPSIATLLTSNGTGGLVLVGIGQVGGTIALSTLGELEFIAVSIFVGAGAFSTTYLFAKKAKLSSKATSSNKPSWVNESMVDPNKTAQQNAKDILDMAYGPNNWKNGPGSEYNRIVKWIIRHLKYYRGW